MASAAISGAIFIQDVSGTTIESRTFAPTVAVSQYVTHKIILANGVSEFVVSLASVSIPNIIYVTATSLVRINPGIHIASAAGTCGVSTASAGMQFKDLFVWMGSGMSGGGSLHFANSSGDSSVITMIMGM